MHQASMQASLLLAAFEARGAGEYQETVRWLVGMHVPRQQQAEGALRASCKCLRPRKLVDDPPFIKAAVQTVYVTVKFCRIHRSDEARIIYLVR